MRLTGVAVFGGHAHADLHGASPGVIRGGLDHERVAGARGCNEVQAVDGRCDTRRATVSFGNDKCRAIAQAHYQTAKHGVLGVQIVRKNFVDILFDRRF